jgi:hypothetical protein
MTGIEITAPVKGVRAERERILRSPPGWFGVEEPRA